MYFGAPQSRSWMPAGSSPLSASPTPSAASSPIVAGPRMVCASVSPRHDCTALCAAGVIALVSGAGSASACAAAPSTTPSSPLGDAVEAGHVAAQDGGVGADLDRRGHAAVGERGGARAQDPALDVALR